MMDMDAIRRMMSNPAGMGMQPPQQGGMQMQGSMQPQSQPTGFGDESMPAEASDSGSPHRETLQRALKRMESQLQQQNSQMQTYNERAQGLSDEVTAAQDKLNAPADKGWAEKYLPYIVGGGGLIASLLGGKGATGVAGLRAMGAGMRMPGQFQNARRQRRIGDYNATMKGIGEQRDILGGLVSSVNQQFRNNMGLLGDYAGMYSNTLNEQNRARDDKADAAQQEIDNAQWEAEQKLKQDRENRLAKGDATGSGSFADVEQGGGYSTDAKRMMGLYDKSQQREIDEVLRKAGKKYGIRIKNEEALSDLLANTAIEVTQEDLVPYYNEIDAIREKYDYQRQFFLEESGVNLGVGGESRAVIPYGPGGVWDTSEWPDDSTKSQSSEPKTGVRELSDEEIIRQLSP